MPALLALADGSLFYGQALGVAGQTVGEVVFNTAMTGYQEILSDPSYAQQIVTLTYPHIGNVGINEQDLEANQVWAAGLIIRDKPLQTSNWRSEQSLEDFLQQRNVVGICDIDTRRLTRLLRDKGAQSGCIMAGDIDEAAALAAARGFAGLEQVDLAKVVSTAQSYQWQQPVWQWGQTTPHTAKQALPYKVVVYDYGVKHNILRLLVSRGCQLTVVPAETSAKKVLSLRPDAVFLSNGPGDPAACDYAISAIQTLLEADIPVFGICLGHQLLALACGAKTVKMKFGHHGANHPVQDLTTQQVFISSQNHGFTVDEASLPGSLQVTHRSLFDGTIQGIRHTDKPAFAFQGHPEASPGPHDILHLFDQFVALIEQQQTKQSVATEQNQAYVE